MSKVRVAEDVWDKTPRKLLICILEASNLAAKDSNGSSDAYCKIAVGKQNQQKTRTIKKSLNPRWDEIFFFEHAHGEDILISLWAHKSIGSDEFLGQISIDSPEKLGINEQVVDRWIDLTVRALKKKDVAQGKIHIRMTYSTEQETKPQQMPSSMFFYETYLNYFKMGDILVYNEIGILPNMIKLVSNSHASRLAMIIELPNRWTEKFELYVVEVTRNIDRLIDAYNDRRDGGVRIFRLFDRIHQMHALSISWAPLKIPLEQPAGQKLVDWIVKVRAGADYIDPKEKKEIDNSIIPTFLNQEFEFRKNHIDVTELYSTDFFLKALKLCGRIPENYTPNAGICTPSSVAALDCFHPPVLLRDRVPVMPPVNDPVAQQQQQQPQNYQMMQQYDGYYQTPMGQPQAIHASLRGHAGYQYPMAQDQNGQPQPHLVYNSGSLRNPNMQHNHSWSNQPPADPSMRGNYMPPDLMIRSSSAYGSLSASNGNPHGNASLHSSGSHPGSSPARPTSTLHVSSSQPNLAHYPASGLRSSGPIPHLGAEAQSTPNVNQNSHSTWAIPPPLLHSQYNLTESATVPPPEFRTSIGAETSG